MNYAELVESLVQITKRPERIPQIQLAIAKATLKAHLADFWLRDIKEVKVTLDQTYAPRYTLTVSSDLPGMRKVSYILGYDAVTNPQCPRVMQQFEENQPSQVRDNYGWTKDNVFYRAGDVLTLWGYCERPPQVLIGYWITPNVKPDNYVSWIAELYPNILLDEASVEIFGSIGMTDEANRRRNEWAPNLAILRTNEIETTGR